MYFTDDLQTFSETWHLPLLSGISWRISPQQKTPHSEVNECLRASPFHHTTQHVFREVEMFFFCCDTFCFWLRTLPTAYAERKANARWRKGFLSGPMRWASWFSRCFFCKTMHSYTFRRALHSFLSHTQDKATKTWLYRRVVIGRYNYVDG